MKDEDVDGNVHSTKLNLMKIFLKLIKFSARVCIVQSSAQHECSLRDVILFKK